MVLGLAALSTIPFTELPILRDTTVANVAYRIQLWHDRLLLAPHVLCGVIALLSGPLQFSTRIHRKYLSFHSVLGQVYGISVLVAAVIALVLTQGSWLETPSTFRRDHGSSARWRHFLRRATGTSRSTASGWCVPML